MTEEIAGPKRIALVGTSPNHWPLAPFNDPSWTIWGISRLFMDPRFTRWDVWFELHKLEDVCKNWKGGDRGLEAAARSTYLEWLGRQTKPIYVREERPEVPSGIRYPIQQILQVFPRAYFTNTISYMLALAICMKPEEIGVWGVDMALNEEYGYQRPSCEYWIGLAEGMGIKVTIPNESSLLKASRLYGLQDAPAIESMLMAKRQEIRQRLQGMQQQTADAQTAMAAAQGALEMISFMEQNWGVGEGR